MLTSVAAAHLALLLGDPMGWGGPWTLSQMFLGSCGLGPWTRAFLTHGVPSTRTTIVLVAGRVASTHATQVGLHESSWIKADPEPDAWHAYKKRREERHTQGRGCVTRKPRECRPPRTQERQETDTPSAPP